MAEAVRNVVLAMVAVTSLHLLILMSDKGPSATPRESPDGTTPSSHEHAPVGSQCLRQESFLADSQASGGSSSGMPMDGLREMFEFASAKGACTDGVACNRPDLGPTSDGARVMKRTNDVYPEQIAGPYAVVNAYDDAASFEACQTEGTNSH
jgi:hypothetical protein